VRPAILGCQHARASRPQDEQAVVQGARPGRLQAHADLHGRGAAGSARLFGH